MHRGALQLPRHVSVAALERTEADDHPLHPEEEALVGPRTAPERRSTLQLGRGAARIALAGIGYRAVPIPAGSDGQPLWPEGVVGSITHTGEVAIAAVATIDTCGGLGIDVERRHSWFDGLEYQIAVAEERERLRGLTGQRRRDATLEMFSAKESIFKAFFPRVGRWFGFDAAAVTSDGEQGRVTVRFTAPIDSAYPPGRPIAVDCTWDGDLVMTSVVLLPA